MNDEEIDFRGFVKRCAKDHELVAYFNCACRTNLQAPIASLLDDSWTHSASVDERLAIGAFIVFVHQCFWGEIENGCESQQPGCIRRAQPSAASGR